MEGKRKGMEEKSRGLLLKDWIGRGGKREGRRWRRKGGEQPGLTIKNRPRASGQ